MGEVFDHMLKRCVVLLYSSKQNFLRSNLNCHHHDITSYVWVCRCEVHVLIRGKMMGVLFMWSSAPSMLRTLTLTMS